MNLAKLQAQPPATLVEGYREKFNRAGDQEVLATFDVPWSGRKQWIDFMLGYSTSLQLPGQNPTITRTIPFQVPVPTYEHLFATEVESTQLAGTLAPAAFLCHKGNGAIQLAADGNAVWTPWLAIADPSTGGDGLIRYGVRFRSYPYEILDDATAAATAQANGTTAELCRYVERHPKGAVQALPLPTGQVKYVNGPFANQAIPDNAAYLLLPTEEWLYVWHEVPDLPLVAMANATGGVNQAPFDGAPGWRAFPAGTLLCQAPQRERYRTSNGRIYWRITYAFLYRPQGHNFLPASDGNFYQVGFGGNANAPLYPSVDFNALFQPPAPVTYQ